MGKTLDIGDYYGIVTNNGLIQAGKELVERTATELGDGDDIQRQAVKWVLPYLQKEEKFEILGLLGFVIAPDNANAKLAADALAAVGRHQIKGKCSSLSWAMQSLGEGELKNELREKLERLFAFIKDGK